MKKSNPGIDVQGAFDLEAAAAPRILCVRVDRLGDMLVSTPLFPALRKRWPNARIDVLTSPGGAAALRSSPHIDTIHVYDKRRWLSLPGLWLRLRRNHYDVTLNIIPGSKTNAALTTWAHGKLRYNLLQQPLNELSPPVQAVVQNPRHMSAAMLELAWVMGCTELEQRLDFHVTDAARRAVAAAWPPSSLTRVGVFVGNIRKYRTRWPVEKFQELCRELLLDPQLEIILIAGPEDEPLLAGFPTDEPRLRAFVGRGSLEETAALIAGCRLFVTSSSGPQHLAAAMGTPSVSVMHQEGYPLWTPVGPQHKAVVSELEIDVRPVPVDQVLAVVRQALAE